MNRRLLPILLTIFTSLILLSCKKDKSNSYIPNSNENSYYQILSLIEQNSIKKNEINWSDIKKEVKDSINTFKNTEDIYRAIRYTLKLINDRHSNLWTLKESNEIKWHSDSSTLLETRVIDGDIGYLKLNNGLECENEKITDFYRTALRKVLLQIDSSSNISGWVIDLRDNSGGDVSCETLGLSPLFAQPLIGIFCNNKHAFTNVVCTKSVLIVQGVRVDTLICDSILKNQHKKIAILVGKNTASAGEFLAIAFKFQNNTKIFGSKTYGATSSISFFDFTDTTKLVMDTTKFVMAKLDMTRLVKAKLNLATTNFCDTNKNLYKEGITPDIICDSAMCIKMAVEWIKQPGKNNNNQQLKILKPHLLWTGAFWPSLSNKKKNGPPCNCRIK